MTADRVTVRTRRAAIALTAGAGDVREDASTLRRRTPAEAAHPPSNQVQRGPDAQQRLQDRAERHVGIAVMDVPSVAGVIGQARVCGCPRQQPVEQLHAVGVGLRVHDLEPGREKTFRGGQVGTRRRRLDEHSGVAAPLRQSVWIRRWIVDEVDGELNRIRAVRVALHNDITSHWRHEGTPTPLDRRILPPNQRRRRRIPPLRVWRSPHRRIRTEFARSGFRFAPKCVVEDGRDPFRRDRSTRRSMIFCLKSTIGSSPTRGDGPATVP